MLPSATWLDELSPRADRDALLALRAEAAQRLGDPRWDAARSRLASVADIQTAHAAIDGDCITLGRAGELTLEAQQRLDTCLQALIPWKKGPFSLFGTAIDAEWRSDLKWQRLAAHVGSLEQQLVADIGCHNGYFMYRMRAHGARTVIGFEPFAQHFFTWSMLQRFHRFPELHCELYGVEHTELFRESFDTIFCLGILYHHTDPVGLLRKLRLALKSGGRIFIDCQGIAGDDPLSLTPQGRYAGASGIWFLPTLSALRHWASRAGFGRIETLFSEPLQTEEQRSTAWAPIKSLSDFLDPLDPQRTIEGYPAPWRHYILLRP